MTEEKKKAESILATWLDQKSSRWKLFARKEYRRESFALFFIFLKSTVSLEHVFFLFALIPFICYFVVPLLYEPEYAFMMLQVIYTVYTALIGNTIYEKEERSGTLEGLWLANGGGGALLSLKLLAWYSALIPSIALTVALTSHGTGEPIGVVWSVLSLLILMFFTFAVSHLFLVMFRGVWISASITLILLGLIFTFQYDQHFLLNPFLNVFFSEEEKWLPGSASFILNRVFLFTASMIILQNSCSYLHRILGDR